MYLGVLADRDMLLQSAINLLSNAIKYTPEGGSVTLRSRLEAGQVRFEVQDTGVGLSEEDRQRVFEKFYRVADSEGYTQGTGLGLSVSLGIVKKLGGTIQVRSRVGEGTTFTVLLPILNVPASLVSPSTGCTGSGSSGIGMTGNGISMPSASNRSLISCMIEFFNAV